MEKGSIEYQGEDLLELDVDERACEGIFLAFQYPVELPGVNNTYFLKSALNAQRKHRGEEEIDAMDFMDIISDKIKLLKSIHKLTSIDFHRQQLQIYL